MKRFDTPHNRRYFLAGIPAAAATVAMPAAALEALPGPSADDPMSEAIQALQGRCSSQLRAIAAMLSGLSKDREESEKVLQAITDALKCTMAERATDAELLALKPKFDEAFDDWRASIERRFPPMSNDEFDLYCERLFGLTREILGYIPVTREGLTLQCRAMVVEEWEVWSEPVRFFIASVASFLRLDFPPRVHARLFADWDDEDEADDGMTS